MRRTFGWLALIALLAAVLASCGKASQGPQETARSFLEALGKRDFVTAYGMLSADSQASIAAEDFAANMQNAWNDAGIAGFKVEAVRPEILSASGTRASVPYSVTLTKNSGETAVVYNALSLVKQGKDTWGVIWPPTR